MEQEPEKEVGADVIPHAGEIRPSKDMYVKLNGHKVVLSSQEFRPNTVVRIIRTSKPSRDELKSTRLTTIKDLKAAYAVRLCRHRSYFKPMLKGAFTTFDLSGSSNPVVRTYVIRGNTPADDATNLRQDMDKIGADFAKVIQSFPGRK